MRFIRGAVDAVVAVMMFVYCVLFFVFFIGGCLAYLLKSYFYMWYRMARGKTFRQMLLDRLATYERLAPNGQTYRVEVNSLHKQIVKQVDPDEDNPGPHDSISVNFTLLAPGEDSERYIKVGNTYISPGSAQFGFYAGNSLEWSMKEFDEFVDDCLRDRKIGTPVTNGSYCRKDGKCHIIFEAE